MEFRKLRADEIDVRVATVTSKGASLLLYKDARCDMNILDETVGSMNWQRCHTRENANCIVSLWDDEKGQWISKEDTGTESFTEKEKGLASDSFKRACFNWGIGRELYTAPFIFVEVATTRYEKTDRYVLQDKYIKFVVDSIEYTDNVISGLVIKDVKGNIWFTFGKNKPKKTSKESEKVSSDNKEKKAEEIKEKYKKANAWLDSQTPTKFKQAKQNVIDSLNELINDLDSLGYSDLRDEIKTKFDYLANQNNEIEK